MSKPLFSSIHSPSPHFISPVAAMSWISFFSEHKMLFISKICIKQSYYYVYVCLHGYVYMKNKFPGTGGCCQKNAFKLIQKKKSAEWSRFHRFTIYSLQHLFSHTKSANNNSNVLWTQRSTRETASRTANAKRNTFKWKYSFNIRMVFSINRFA